MAEADEPQLNTLAERIAALNKQKNFSSPEPVRKRPPPPPPPGRPLAETRSRTLPVISTTSSSQPNPVMPPRPKRQNPPPLPQNSGASHRHEAQHDHQSPSAPPPLPTRTSTSSSAQPSPALPPRRPSAQSSNLMVRRNSNSSEISQHSTLSSLSLGRTSTTSYGSEGTVHKLPPAFDPASLPQLPPSKREREAKEAAAQQTAQPKHPLVSVKSAPAVPRRVEAAPAAKPSLPPRLPSRPAKPHSNPSADNVQPSQPRKMPPIMGFGSGKKQAPEERPPLPGRPSQTNDEPPPVPLASRPSLAQIEAASSRAVAPVKVQDDCWICRDWSGPDDVAAQFPRQQLPRNDPVGHLARGLCDPFPSYTDKARAIFTWFHHNIWYDTVSFFGKCVKHMSVEDTIFSGKAVCQGYADTYKAIANRAGLECVVVSGHGKGYGYTPLKKGERPPPPKPDGHAWNAVRIDGGEWKLLDACWGAGHLGEGNVYKQEFSPTQFTKTNDKFGISHFPKESRYQFRNDGRTIDWDEYYIGPVSGEPPTFYTNGHQEGIAQDSVEPKVKQIPVYSGEVVRFQFSKICEHWTSEKHGLGKPPLLLLSIHGHDGRKDEMIPIETDGYWHWVDVNARDLGAPGQAVQVAQLTSIGGQDGRGVSAREFFAKKGKVGMSWAYAMRWELI
ncbi:Fc.00g087700.m01.CDS01 [Cosmosporella sp. VM-42]